VDQKRDARIGSGGQRREREREKKKTQKSVISHTKLLNVIASFGLSKTSILKLSQNSALKYTAIVII
jgi:hypothetical protein